MCGNSPISDVTQAYLCRFYNILDEMIQGMTGAEVTDSISHNFIVQMIPHHEAAIQMSENLLQYTTCVPLQRIAQAIVREQTESIANMRRALPVCAQLKNTSCELSRYGQRFDAITQRMFSRMRHAAADNNLNADFMREMIPHHEGAIRMSKNALQFPICPELVPILKAIIRSQEKGIREMQCLLCGR